MATIVNTTPATSDNNSGLGTIVGLGMLLLIIFLVLYYGLPALNRMGSTGNTPAAPAGDSSNTMELQVPDKVDVNVNSGQE